MPFGVPVLDEKTILCEECGKKFKKLAHPHLFKKHGLSVPQYKEKWGFKIGQPLEAGYIKKIRQEYIKIYGKDKNLETVKYKIKKGQHLRKYRIISEQEKIKLASHAVNIQHTDKFKKIISKASKNVWKRKGYKKKYIENYKIKLNCSGEEFRKRMSEQAKSFWDKPENRKMMSEKRKLIWNTPEKKLYASNRAKEYWAKKMTSN